MQFKVPVPAGQHFELPKALASIETGGWLASSKNPVHLCIKQFSSFCPHLRTDCSTSLALQINSISFKSPYLEFTVAGCSQLLSPCYFLQQSWAWWGRAGTLTLVQWTDREGSAWLVGNCHIIKNNFAFIPRRKTTAWKPQTSLF